MSTSRCAKVLLAAWTAALLLQAGAGAPAAQAQTLPPGFQEEIVFSGLTAPTALEFAADGRVFVAEKSGIIKVFDNLLAVTPTVFADLSTQVYNFWDRGLLGLAVDPAFPARPYVYVLYTHDAEIGGTAPRWGTPGVLSDPCPTPPGPTADGCVVSGRLSRLEAAGNVMTGVEQVLVEGWCQQYPSHSLGALGFGPDGALYANGGDGASFTFSDYGQGGNPRNPCGDPPVPIGGVQAPPTAEGGALRSQSLERLAGEPAVLNGALLRLDPDTGEAALGNPLSGSADANARRIVAYGFRNPFRFAFRPGTSEVWVGDVGWDAWEEINRVLDPTAAVSNFGWPCYEGPDPQLGYIGLDLDICDRLAQKPEPFIKPALAYNHAEKVVPGEACPTGGASTSGLAFYAGTTYPAEYSGALFFADFTRNCIWVLLNPPPPPLPAPLNGLVAAYSFNEGGGGAVADASGNGHSGAITNATWTTGGRFGNALSFNGVDSWVTVDTTPLLDLTSAVTVMAWVNPTTASGVQDILIREGAGVDVYNLYARNWRGLPEANVFVGGSNRTAEGAELPANTWTHVAGTYDGAMVRLFINGAQVAATPVTGPIATGAGPLRIGGNGIWGEFFSGLIDEVRVYNRPLTAGEIQADMNAPLPSPQPPTVRTFVEGAAGPVDLRVGPDGNLYYVDFDGGTIRRIRFTSGNRPPIAVIQATPTTGAAPLTVAFDATGSSDPDGDALTYSWDLDGDGTAGDSTAAQPTFTYTTPGLRRVTLTVSDSQGASSTTTTDIVVGTAPVATIEAPSETLTWKAGDLIAFSGAATDAEDGALPASALTWSIILHHCPSGVCHTHQVMDVVGVATGSFVAPDHEYPSHLELRLTARDSSGLTDAKSVLLQPQTVTLSFASVPSGLQLVVGSGAGTTPFTRTVITQSNNSISAPSPQQSGGSSYVFASWSDGGAQSHNIIASASATYTATYAPASNGLVAAYGFNEGAGTAVGDASGNGHTGTITQATWTTAGKFGNALTFNGTSAWVTVNATPALNLTNALTIMAWIRPTISNGVRDILIKEGSGVDIYNLYARNWRGRPEANAFVGGTNYTAEGTALPINTWTHVAGTYDGGVVRLFVNGAQVASTPVPGAIPPSDGPLRIGGNSIWGEFFSGQIDEIRIYNRALAASEIQADMASPVQ